MVLPHENAFEDVKMVDAEDDDSTLNNMITSSAHICDTQLLDASIEDVRNKKKIMDLKIDSVINLMNKVEYEEKAADKAKKEAADSRSDVILKICELVETQQRLKKKNDMFAREAHVQKNLLFMKMESLQLHVTNLIDKGDESLELLNDMSRSLEVRLTSAITEKKSAIKEKQANEASAIGILAELEARMSKVKEESNRLKQEAVEISKLQEFVTDCGHLVTMLHGAITDKCQEVKRLKEELDLVVPQDGKMRSRRKSSVSPSNSALVSSIIPCQSQPELAESDLVFRKDSVSGKGDSVDEYVQSANCEHIKSVIWFSEADAQSPHGVVDINRLIKKVTIKGKLHGFQMKIKRRRNTNQMFANCIKKVKLKGKLHENKIFSKRMKKIKIKSKLHGNQISAMRIKKLKINDRRRGSHVRAKGVKMQHGRHVCAKSINNLKKQGKRHRSQICGKSIKKVKIKNILHGSQLCPKSIKKRTIKGNHHGCKMCAKSIKQVKIKRKQGYQMCFKSIEKVKIKGLQVVRAAADHRDQV